MLYEFSDDFFLYLLHHPDLNPPFTLLWIYSSCILCLGETLFF